MFLIGYVQANPVPEMAERVFRVPNERQGERQRRLKY